jgi:hypothetical protein
VLLYFVRADGMNEEIDVTHLTFTAPGAPDAVGGKATTIDGVISTRRPNGSPWRPLRDPGPGPTPRTPAGVWELSLRTDNPDRDQQIQSWFKNDKIEDILLIISCSGHTPAWPA